MAGPTLRVPHDLRRPHDVNPIIFDQISRLVSTKPQENISNSNLYFGLDKVTTVKRVINNL